MNPMRVTIRARVLRAVNASPDWQSARAIAQATGLQYLQTVFALNALYNAGHIARHGKKTSARWGSAVLVEHNPTAEALATLNALFHAHHQQPDHP